MLRKHAALLLFAMIGAIAAKQLTQASTCSAAQIPGCVPSQRVVRFRQGCVCLKCLQTRGFVPAARSRLDKKAALQCVCRPGFFEQLGTCAPCTVGAFCPGGNSAARTTQDDRGTRKACAVGYTTVAARAVSAQQCVPVTGTVLSSPDPLDLLNGTSLSGNSSSREALCSGDTYAAPPSNTLQSCIRCPKGLVAPPGFTGPHRDKVTVCHVPPGLYYTGISTRDCPQGTHRGGFGRIDDPASLQCTPCPEGSTTETFGSTNITDCKLCIDGWGKVPAGNAGAYATEVCGPCNYGEWSNSGYQDTVTASGTSEAGNSIVSAAAAAATSAVLGGACRLCPGTTFQHAVGMAFVSYGLTFATKNINPESCVPRFSQLPVAAGAKLAIQNATAFTLVEAGTNLRVCVQACPVDSCCIAEFESDDGSSSTSGTCRRAVLPPLGRGDMTKPALYYKLPPSSMMSGAGLEEDGAHGARRRLQSAGSGLFARCDMSQWGTLPAEGYIGVSPNPSLVEAPATTVEWNAAGCTDEASCKDSCLFDAPCWGFIFVPGPGHGWALRGGEDSLGVRTFFAIPDPTKTTQPFDMEALKW